VRILLFSSTYAPLIGGVETVTRRLSRELKERGHDVTVVTNRYPRTLAAEDSMDGIRVIRRLYPNLLPSPGRRPASVIAKQILSPPLAAFELVSLYQLMRRHRPDVVNVHYFSYPAAYALVAAQLAKIPAVLCFHGSDVPAVPYPATYTWAARWGCGLSRQVICCSENLRSYLVQDLAPDGVAKTSVSHYGIDIPDVSAKNQEPETRNRKPPVVEGPFMLLLARLVEKKAVDIAIRAMKELRDAGIPGRLVILGSGPFQAPLEGLASDLGVAGDVIFAGSVAHDAARTLIERALFVVVPSHWEAFGMVCLEAMAAGKAVIGSSNGGIAEIVVDGETGRLVPPGDPKALAAAMRSLLEDLERAEEMGDRGRRRARDNFTWAQMAARYEAVFDRAIQTRRGRHD